MVAFFQRRDGETDTDEQAPSETRKRRSPKHALARDMLHGLTPEEFDHEAKAVAGAEALTPKVRERLRTQLVERLKTPIDPPSWGPDWIKRPKNSRPLTQKLDEKPGVAARILGWVKSDRRDAEDDAGDIEERTQDDDAVASALPEEHRADAQVIAHNMEKSRQVWHFRSLYLLSAAAALAIAGLAIFVDFQIIKGDIWTRALANEFMVVPQSLQATLLFKSLQVVFAVLIVHFMLKITGVYGRHTMITAAFILALVMIGGLGYLVAYNNMTGGTSTTLEHMQSPQNNSIDQLFAGTSARSEDGQGRIVPARLAADKTDDVGQSLPRPSERFLANADSWFWLAFASVIFFIVTTVAALYMQVFENNLRNYLISRDYPHRRKQFAQLHLLELADQNGAASDT